ncbi:MAG: dihydroneopterin aldolase [Vicingaceae bacterium]
MHKVLLENMMFHAKHGVFEEETTIGGSFEVNLEMETDFSKAMETDQLEGTIDYSRVYELIEQEMNVPSKLLEHLAKRILDVLYENFTTIQYIRLKISKMNPPINGEVERVSIVIEE